MAPAPVSVSAHARLSYLALYSIRRSFTTTTSRCSSGQFNRSDFGGQPFTGVYEPGGPTIGPLGGTSNVGAPRITPKALKQHLDQFVVGQERAKKVLSVAVYNHYQRIQELERQDEEEAELHAQQARREMGQRHPVEGSQSSKPEQLYMQTILTFLADEFPGQQPTIHLYPPPNYQSFSPPPDSSPILDTTPLTIEKSNILLLGPSGVGKTLMAKTLARVLEVPFSMSDCTPFTQAGYIGEDADVCVQRLLAAADYDVARAERGIICLDEIDKIAAAKVAHGKDVSGEGVQQALLKIIEGTTLQIQAKAERGAGGSGPGTGRTTPGGGFPSHSPLGGGGLGGGNMNPLSPGGAKNEVYNVRTDNILFIFTGAFIGLHKMILDRISRGSIGFGAHVRASSPETGTHDTMLRGEDALFKKHLPFYVPETHSPQQQPSSSPGFPRHNTTASSGGKDPQDEPLYNTLDLVEPSDLQKYGLIPELIGRIPISCALSPLSASALVRVLTEPRNSLLKQYEQLFQLSGIELRFTTASLHEVARVAKDMGTGARGLRTVLERLLGDAMFEAPGSGIKYVLVTEGVARREAAPIYFGRGDRHRFHATIAAEEEAWEARLLGKEEVKRGAVRESPQSFEEYRQKAAGGFV